MVDDMSGEIDALSPCAMFLFPFLRVHIIFRFCVLYALLGIVLVRGNHPSTIDGSKVVKMSMDGNRFKARSGPRSRQLLLTANSIACSEVTSQPGDFCGSISVANFTASGANTNLFASNFAAFLKRNPLFGVKEYVIKYKTQLEKNGTAVSATGIVVLPNVEAVQPPVGGFPIVVWCHYAVGISDDYAPSEDFFKNTMGSISASLRTYFRNYPANGFILVAPDYAGLGVPDIPHYFLVKKPTAYSIIDSVRAATSFAKGQGYSVSPKTIFFGHSQGGCAVLQAQEVYDGPEAYGKRSFELKAVVSIAPAPVWRFAFPDIYASYNRALAADVGLYFWAAAQYNNNLSLSELLSPAAISTLDTYAETLSSESLETGNYFAANVTDYLSLSSGVYEAIQSSTNDLSCYLSRSTCEGNAGPYNLSHMSLSGLSIEWQTQLDEDSPGLKLFSSVPVLLLQGSADTIVRPYYSVMLAQQLWNNGVPMVDSSGKSIEFNGLSDFANELNIAANCNNNGNVVTCGLSHYSIPLAIERYAPFIFSKADILSLQASQKSIATGGSHVWMTLNAVVIVVISIVLM
jgi:pimeloyl-ACP methyl ester carboxylesterase